MTGTVEYLEERRDPPLEANLTKTRSNKGWRSAIWFPDDPGFLFYIRQEWLDLFTIAILLITALLLINFAHPLPPRYFPLTQGGLLVSPQYAYPRLDEYITTTVSAIISFGLPFAIMGLCSIFLIGNFWDANSALKGLGFALCTSNLFQLILKLLIGGLRPHFYAVCRPPASPGGGTGYNTLYHTRSICTNPNRREVSNALMSFPSGHCCAAFAGFGFLALWTNAKFKVCADYKSAHWQQVMLAAPICIALLLSLSKIVDYWHHWYDVLAGSLIGIFFALLSYRQVYWSVFDWRYNHIPLPYAFELNTAVEPVVATRGLTCIDFAGWENKYSDHAGEIKEKEPLAQVDGVEDDIPPRSFWRRQEPEESKKGMLLAELRRFDPMSFLV